jgi:hypothetical protein
MLLGALVTIEVLVPFAGLIEILQEYPASVRPGARDALEMGRRFGESVRETLR